MRAIIPAAGLGTRMAAITRGAPKELLSVGRSSVLSYVVNEAFLSGASEVCVVGSRLKPAISEFVLGSGDPRLLLREQAEPLGIADAVRAGAEAGQPALVLMGDTVFASGSPVFELRAKLEEGAWAAVAVHEVPLEEVSHYGVVGFDATGQITQIVEKPAPLDAPGRFAIASRFALSGEASSALFEALGQRVVPNLTLTDVLEEGLRAGKRVAPVFLVETARLYDCGQPEGYFAAVEALGS